MYKFLFASEHFVTLTVTATFATVTLPLPSAETLSELQIHMWFPQVKLYLPYQQVNKGVHSQGHYEA